VGGRTIDYVYDGLGRRVGRRAPEGTTRYLYGNPSQPFQISVMLDPSGVVARYYYDDDGCLFAFERLGTRFYVFTDLRGTPRVIVRADGTIVRTVRHDSYGVVLADSDSSFDLPVGFAGGLPDATTGLVRFGWRDYEPASGRWTAPDPLLHQSPDPNPYLYANGNPVTYADPWGLLCVAASAYAGIGGGGSVCFDGSGASACVELGVGVGAGAGVSTGGPSPGGTSFGAEVSASLGLAGGSLSGNINECGKASVDASLGLGPSVDGRTIGKVGVSAKITVTHCWRLN
jgi:RHS repeat-associated protein